MKKRLLLIFIIFLITSPYVLSLDVSLSTPTISGSSVTLKCTVTDSGSEGLGDLISWHNITGTFSTNETNTTTVSSGSEFTFTTLTSVADGTYLWNCQANNRTGSNFFASSNSTFTIAANSPNFDSISNFLIDEDTTKEIILNNNISDSETSDTDLTFSFTNSNTNILSIVIDDSTNNLSFFPKKDKNGQATINVTVLDSNNNQNSTQFVLTINSTNDPPSNKTAEIETQSWFENKNRELDLTDYFRDIDGDSLTYISTQPDHINITIDNSTGEATLTPQTDWTGSETATFTAYDPNFTSFTSNSVNLTVKVTSGLNNAPEIDTFSPTDLTPEIKPNKEIKFNITRSDPDNDTLNVTWYLNDKLTKTNVDQYTYKNNGTEGIYKIEVIVSDSNLISTKEWVVTVNENASKISTQETILEVEESLCGNGVVDAGENCNSCTLDVICNVGESCVNNRCSLVKKSNTTIIIIIAAIILLIGIAVAFYFYKKKQKDLGLVVPPLKSGEKRNKKIRIGPAVELEDFYGEPKNPHQIRKYTQHVPESKTKKPEKTKKYNRVHQAVLRNYIKNSLKRKHSKAKIKKNLINTGWDEKFIDDVLKKF